MKKIICAVLAIVFSLCFSVTAFAQASPTAHVVHNIEVGSSVGGESTYEVEEEDEDIYVIIAKPDDGYVFVGWKIDGDYIFVEGDEKSDTAKIKVNSDVKVVPIYEKETTAPTTTKKGETTAPTKPGETTQPTVQPTTVVTAPADHSDVAPQTGDNSALYVFVLIGAAAIVAFVSKKVLVK